MCPKLQALDVGYSCLQSALVIDELPTLFRCCKSLTHLDLRMVLQYTDFRQELAMLGQVAGGSTVSLCNRCAAGDGAVPAQSLHRQSAVTVRKLDSRCAPPKCKSLCGNCPVTGV